MVRKFLISLALLVALSVPASAQKLPSTPENGVIKELFEADQADRKLLMQLSQASANERKNQEEQVWKRDELRRAKILDLLKARAIMSAADYWRAAFVFQHGASLEDIRLAYSLATVAVAISPEEKKYRWLTAASWDRILTYKKQPQWYGTQFERDPATGLQRQSEIDDDAVTDVERAALGVPTLAESQEMLKQINGLRN